MMNRRARRHLQRRRQLRKRREFLCYNLAKRKLTCRGLIRSRQEAKLDSEIDALLEPDVTNDSIMDDELEESDDEDEVNSILASDEDEP